jgi:integrase
MESRIRFTYTAPTNVARQLGHASVAITEKHYTRWIPQAVPAVHQLDDAAEPIGSKAAVW